MTAFDVIVRNGSMVDGTGAPAVFADVGIVGDRISAIGDLRGERAVEEVDAEGHLVTPGFVDIHTHLDAQLAWDPIGSSSCWHGVTTVVMGNCGVTFAPCRPDDRAYLAEMMESVEDIPATRDPRRPSVGLADLRRVPGECRPHAQRRERRRDGRSLRGPLPRDG